MGTEREERGARGTSQAGNGKGEMTPQLEESGAATASALPWPGHHGLPSPWSLHGPRCHQLCPSSQVVNGLMERPDWADAMKKPLCILPGGSGNALAASINYYAG